MSPVLGANQLGVPRAESWAFVLAIVAAAAGMEVPGEASAGWGETGVFEGMYAGEEVSTDVVGERFERVRRLRWLEAELAEVCVSE